MRHPDRAERQKHQAAIDLLTPVVKGWCTEQGIEIGRPGRASVRVEPDGDGWRVQVGGTAVTVLEAELRLPI